jgi:hypothetical protein
MVAPDFQVGNRGGENTLAVAIAYRAIQNGFDALLVTRGTSQGRPHSGAWLVPVFAGRAFARRDRCLTSGADDAKLFRVVNDRHRNKRAMIFITTRH